MHPNFGLNLRKQKENKKSENGGSGYAKLALKDHVLDTRLEMSLHAPAIHEMISSSDGFFRWSVALKSWNAKGWRTEVNLLGIKAKLVFSFANTAFTLSVT